MLGDAPAERRRDWTVDDRDTAERRHRIGGERALPRLLDRRRDRDAAGIRVLHDHGGRERELAAHAPRALEVGEVVVRELLAAELLDSREQVAARAVLPVVRGRLMRVLAVREVGHLAERQRQLLGERLRFAEPVRDRRLVRRRRRERLGRERAARLERHGAAARGARRARARTARAVETAATCAKFFAAARSIDGPPTSIISTISASVTPRRPATDANG